MKIIADLYYHVYKVVYGGQGFRDTYTLKGTFDTKDAAEAYIKKIRSEKELYVSYQIEEKIENIKKLT